MELIDNPGFAASIIGEGVLGLDTGYVFQTQMGHNLWARGPMNHLKHGIAPLDAIMETDWFVFGFTMNWRFTVPEVPVRFQEGEPFCTLVPYPAQYIEDFAGEIRDLDDDPKLRDEYEAWVKSRLDYAAMSQGGESVWGRKYMQGATRDGQVIAHHKTKLSLQDFASSRHRPLPSADEARRKWARQQLERMGTVLDGAKEHRQQKEADSAVRRANRASALHEEGQHEQALAEMDRAIAEDPTLAQAFGNERGLILMAFGRFDDAIGCFQEALQSATEMNQRVPVLYNLTIATVRLSGTPSAQQLICELEELIIESVVAFGSRVVALYALAGICAVRGQSERGFGFLEQAIRVDPDVSRWVRYDAARDDLRDEPRFLDLCSPSEETASHD